MGYIYLTFLRKVAHNVLVNYYRKPKATSLEAAGDMPIEIKEGLERRFEGLALWKAIQGLSTNEKDAVLMKYQDEMPVKEIARVMEKSENAVKLLLFRARKKLAHYPYFSEAKKFTKIISLAPEAI